MESCFASRLTRCGSHAAMSKSNWKLPFLRFRDRIRPLFDSGVKLYHGILMAPFHERKDVKDVVENLDPCFRGKSKVAEIETPTEGCQFHSHYFFGDSGGCKVLEHALLGIHDWIQAVPKELLPRFDVSCKHMHEPYRNLAMSSIRSGRSPRDLESVTLPCGPPGGQGFEFTTSTSTLTFMAVIGLSTS